MWDICQSVKFYFLDLKSWANHRAATVIHLPYCLSGSESFCAFNLVHRHDGGKKEQDSICFEAQIQAEDKVSGALDHLHFADMETICRGEDLVKLQRHWTSNPFSQTALKVLQRNDPRLPCRLLPTLHLEFTEEAGRKNRRRVQKSCFSCLEGKFNKASSFSRTRISDLLPPAAKEWQSILRENFYSESHTLTSMGCQKTRSNSPPRVLE